MRGDSNLAPSISLLRLCDCDNGCVVLLLKFSLSLRALIIFPLGRVQNQTTNPPSVPSQFHALVTSHPIGYSRMKHSKFLQIALRENLQYFLLLTNRCIFESIRLVCINNQGGYLVYRECSILSIVIYKI